MADQMERQHLRHQQMLPWGHLAQSHLSTIISLIMAKPVQHVYTAVSYALNTNQIFWPNRTKKDINHRKQSSRRHVPCNGIALLILQGRHLMLSGELDQCAGSPLKLLVTTTNRDAAWPGAWFSGWPADWLDDHWWLTSAWLTASQA